MSGSRQAAIAAVALLIALAALAAGIIARVPVPVTACGPGAALPIQPVRVDYPALHLEAYGRSAGALPPGASLCVAFDWQPDGEIPPGVLIDLALVGEDGQVVAQTAVPLLERGAPVAMVTLPIPANAAAGRTQIVLRLRDRATGQAIPTLSGHASLTLSGIEIDPAAPMPLPAPGGAAGGLHLQGGLETWPFWPHPTPMPTTKEG